MKFVWIFAAIVAWRLISAVDSKGTKIKNDTDSISKKRSIIPFELETGSIKYNNTNQSHSVQKRSDNASFHEHHHQVKEHNCTHNNSKRNAEQSIQLGTNNSSLSETTTGFRFKRRNSNQNHTENNQKEPKLFQRSTNLYINSSSIVQEESLSNRSERDLNEKRCAKSNNTLTQSEENAKDSKRARRLTSNSSSIPEEAALAIRSQRDINKNNQTHLEDSKEYVKEQKYERCIDKNTNRKDALAHCSDEVLRESNQSNLEYPTEQGQNIFKRSADENATVSDTPEESSEKNKTRKNCHQNNLKALKRVKRSADNTKDMKVFTKADLSILNRRLKSLDGEKTEEVTAEMISDNFVSNNDDVVTDTNPKKNMTHDGRIRMFSEIKDENNMNFLYTNVNGLTRPLYGIQIQNINLTGEENRRISLSEPQDLYQLTKAMKKNLPKITLPRKHFSCRCSIIFNYDGEFNDGVSMENTENQLIMHNFVDSKDLCVLHCSANAIRASNFAQRVDCAYMDSLLDVTRDQKRTVACKVFSENLGYDLGTQSKILFNFNMFLVCAVMILSLTLSILIVKRIYNLCKPPRPKHIKGCILIKRTVEA